jgi:major membrane immunogen (membrane-anchored lipoprotein)
MKVKNILMLIILLAVAAFALTGCNMSIIDTTYTFDKAIVYMGNEKIELEIKKWKDYDDGEQIQIETKDGKVYLTSMNNAILIKEGN